MNLLGPAVQMPHWMGISARYYSRIDEGWGDPVRVHHFPEVGDASDQNPGDLWLRLVPRFREVAVVDAGGREDAVIRPRFPGLGYTMFRAGLPAWTVSTRSVVMRRHALSFASGEAWDVRTPFFWWMNVVCNHNGETPAVGQVGPSKRFWLLWIGAGKDHRDHLAALAFMHRRWWRL
jgi:hypothetical protein